VRAVRLTHACGLNERVYGDEGTPLVLDDAEAEHLVEVLKLAVYDEALQRRLDEVLPPEAPVTFVGPEAAAQRMQELVAATEELGLYEPVTDQDALEAGYPVDVESAGFEKPELSTASGRPYGNASKADWVNWAVRQGAKREDAQLLSKRDLMGRYGERL
jgi:hypothetical protein